LIGFEFEFFSILKDGLGQVRFRDIDIHLESAVLILKFDFASFLYQKPLNNLLNYIYIYIFYLSIKQTVFFISYLYLKKKIVKKDNFGLLTSFFNKKNLKYNPNSCEKEM
jgi:hypothetical protein